MKRKVVKAACNVRNWGLHMSFYKHIHICPTAPVSMVSCMWLKTQLDGLAVFKHLDPPRLHLMDYRQA